MSSRSAFPNRGQAPVRLRHKSVTAAGRGLTPVGGAGGGRSAPLRSMPGPSPRPPRTAPRRARVALRRRCSRWSSEASPWLSDPASAVVARSGRRHVQFGSARCAGRFTAPPLRRLACRTRTATEPRSRRCAATSCCSTFLDSKCTNLCPIEGTQLAQVQHDLPAADRPELVVVSVNPADTRASVARFVRQAGWSRPWRWLLGTKRTLAPVWSAYPSACGLATAGLCKTGNTTIRVAGSVAHDRPLPDRPPGPGAVRRPARSSRRPWPRSSRGSSATRQYSAGPGAAGSSERSRMSAKPITVEKHDVRLDRHGDSRDLLIGKRADPTELGRVLVEAVERVVGEVDEQVERADRQEGQREI